MQHAAGRGSLKRLGIAETQVVFRLLDMKGGCAQVRRIELSRTTASGAVAPEFVSELLCACELEGVAKLRCAEGMLPAWHADLFARLDGLRVLNLSSCGLSALPPGGASPPRNTILAPSIPLSQIPLLASVSI